MSVSLHGAKNKLMILKLKQSAMQHMLWRSLILLWLIFAVSCGGGTAVQTTVTPLPPTSTPIPGGQVDAIVHSQFLERKLSEDFEEFDNCGRDSRTDSLSAPPVAFHSLEISSNTIPVNSDGWIDLPFIGDVNIGKIVAEKYNVRYGAAAPITGNPDILLPSNSKRIITFQRIETWAEGTIEISSIDGDRNVRTDYTFLVSYRIDISDRTELNCREEGTAVPESAVP